MSLLGLLDEAPAIAVPDFQALAEPEAPLSREEVTQWNDIVLGLGELSVDTATDTPIWDELSTKYASLLFDPVPQIGELWGDEGWIAADFEEVWSGATPIWEQTLRRMHYALDPENAPPMGFRTTVYEDRSTMDDDALERVLAGLRRL